MSDWVIEAIREVDPCPTEIAAPPIDAVLRRLEGDAAGKPVSRHRSPGITAMAVVLAGGVATAVAVAVLAIAVLGQAHRATPPVARTAQGGGLPVCRSEVRDGVLPPWARSGFSPPRQRLHYVLGEAGRIAAIPFGPLDSPPAADRNNKILWVSRVPIHYDDLRIEAQRMSGSTPLGGPVSRTVMGGPGPSIIDLPSPGCWRVTLRWSGWTDHLDLEYSGSAAGTPSLAQQPSP